MDHEVFVPVSVGRLRDVLADPARIARAVPGLQQDAGTEPAAFEGAGVAGVAGVAGRLKVRIGGHTITYRGSLRVAAADAGEDAYVVEGDAVEARGGGAVKLALTLRVREVEGVGAGADPGAGAREGDAGGGSLLVFGGAVTADGRVAELPPDAVAAAGVRLLRRFGENLGEVAGEVAGEGAGERAGPSGVVEVQVSDADGPGGSGVPGVTDGPDDPGGLDDDEVDGGGEGGEGGQVGGGGQVPGRYMDALEPPAEAAHARRTMIGRSAEEVDHAPPRGRYAPVPPPEQVAANLTLRWAAPAAVLVVASVIVAGRVLRKRR